MPTWNAFSGVAVSSGRNKLYTVGGIHPRNIGPVPTEWILSDQVASLDLATVELR